MPATKVFVADAGSSDGTPVVVERFRRQLMVSVIPGGLPSVGRNAGARLAETPYILFLDADMELADPTIIRRSVELMKRKRLQCLTTSIWCRDGNLLDQLLYGGNNIVQYVSRFFLPFSTGMFMMFDAECFRRLGGFHESALYAEDFLLSKKVAGNRFGIVRGSALTSNRRFQKMGHFKILGLFLKTALHCRNDAYFLRDQRYWQT